MAKLRPSKPVLMFFQEIKPGDVLKYKTTSNVAATGGGARDLRIRPADDFTPILARMFPDPAPEDGVTQGIVHWLDPGGDDHSTTIELWRPTDARPGEARLGRIYEIGAWEVEHAAFQNAIDAGNKWFYLLVLDADGRVWARIMKQENLAGETATVRTYVNTRIGATSAHHAVRGTMDFETGQVYP